MLFNNSKKRNSSFPMKFILLVIIGALLWNNNDARIFTADLLEDASEFVRPETTIRQQINNWIN